MLASPQLFHHLLLHSAEQWAQQTALIYRGQSISYGQLAEQSTALAAYLQNIGLQRFARVAVYLPKQPETVLSIFAITMSDNVFVPINPQLKAAQVGHILNDIVAHGDRENTEHCFGLRHSP